jgi:hypothetical protein
MGLMHAASSCSETRFRTNILGGLWPLILIAVVPAVFLVGCTPTARTYVLTIQGGTGSGTYSAGSVVSIQATVPAGFRFDAWTGNVADVADVHAASTTVTLNANATVTATFVHQFTLTVNEGTGSGTYDAGSVVPIQATVPAGLGFNAWTGDVVGIADVYAASTTVTLSATATVTATFVRRFTLTVNDGTGSGSYNSGSVVPIQATVLAGFRFNAWTGDVAGVADVYAASTTVTLGANATVTATFI